MKTNKSILLLLVSFLFVLASCSQAQYGSMMRKVKPHEKESKEIRIAQDQTESSVKEIEPMMAELDLEELPAFETAEIEQSASSEQSAKTPKLNPERIHQVVKISEAIPASPFIKRTKKKVANQIEEAQESNDDRSLIRLLIIVILLLIILNLILDLLPPIFTGVLGLIILILIFLWLLNYL